MAAPNIKPQARSYQYEMFTESMKHNIIVTVIRTRLSHPPATDSQKTDGYRKWEDPSVSECICVTLFMCAYTPSVQL